MWRSRWNSQAFQTPNQSRAIIWPKWVSGARADHFPAQLSGRRQQRVALARALAPRPKLILADEPTGNLDGKTGRQVVDMLFDLQKRREATLVLVTHDEKLAAAMRAHHSHGGRPHRLRREGQGCMNMRDSPPAADPAVPIARPGISLGRVFVLALRELRSGLNGFYIFIACVALGVAVITAVGALVGRLCTPASRARAGLSWAATSRLRACMRAPPTKNGAGSTPKAK